MSRDVNSRMRWSGLGAVAPNLRELRVLAVTPGRFQVAWLSGLLGTADQPLALEAAADPGEALDRIETGVAFDLCFLDDAVGERAVQQMLKTMRAWGYPFPVILVTEPGGEGLAAEALAEGASDYIYRAETDLPNLVRSVRYALDRHTLSAEARRWQKRYRNVWDRNHSGLYQIDANGRVLDCNQHLARILGYSNPRQLVGRQLMEFALLNDGSISERATPLARGTRPFWSREVRLQCRDGSAKWAILNDAQIDSAFEEAEEGVAVYEGWVLEQVRERELEGLLQRQESLFMALFSAVAEAMVVLDDQGLVTSCNRAAEALLGQEMEELAGRRFVSCFRSFVDASGAPLDSADLPSARTIAASETAEMPLLGLDLPSGERLWARMRSAPVKLPGGRGATSAVVTLIDQTKLQQLELKLVDAQKLEVASLAANGMTHDLRNAVTSMDAMAQLIAERDLTLEDARSHADQIRHAAEHAHALLSQILGFTRHRETELRPVELDPVVHGLSELVRGMVPREIKLQVALGAGRQHVESAVGFIEQIVLNLVINGRDAMPDGGELAIETSVVELAEAKVLGGQDLAPGSYVVLAVKDEGRGMEAPVRNRAFEPFFSTKGPQAGTGLGLWSVQNLAQRSGGVTVIESAPGRGTLVQVYLPVVSRAVSA